MVPLAETDAEKFRQRCNRRNHFLIFPELGKTGYRIQRIVEKMGVNLRLQHIQFTFSFRFLFLNDLIH
ncbi:hypothetical protein D3C76_1326190 [compost metagenome]